MVFVDSSGWYAGLVPSEIDHVIAANWLAHNNEPLLTSDYVIDETLTLLRARRQGQLALAFGEQVFNSQLTQLYLLTGDDIRRAWEIFRLFSDKDWSFTDCTSKVVMQRLGITTAFSFDHHFRQFGTVRIVP
jgi:predicted nucleic acid-binding protein